MKPVTDTALLQQLEDGERVPVQDPALIEELEKPSIGDQAIGLADAAGTVVSGAIAEPIAGLAGALSAPFVGVDESVENINAVRDRLTHDPKTEEGRKNIVSLTKTLKPVADLLERAEKASGDTGFDLAGPIGGAIAAALPAATLELLGLKGARAVSKPRPELTAIEDKSTPQNIQRTTEQIASDSPESIAQTVNPDPEFVAAAEELNMSPIASASSQNRAFIDAEQAVKSRPGSQLAAQEQQSIIDLGDRADALIEDLGGSSDKSLLDATLKDDFDKTVTGLNGEIKTLSDEVDAAIPPSQKINPTDVQQYLSQKLEELGGDKTLLTPVERKLLKLTQEGRTPTYAAIDRVRKDVGNGFNKQGIYGDTDSKILGDVYGVLAADQRVVAESFGVGESLLRRNELVVKKKDLQDQSMAAFGKDLGGSVIPKTKQAANALLNGDVSKLNKLLESVPEGRQSDIAAAVVADIFNSGARTSQGLGQGFVKAYQGLQRNSSAREALFHHLPKEQVRRFNLIGKVATGIYRSKALENNSRTARDILAALDDPSWAAKLYGVGKNVAVAEGATSSAGLPGIGATAVLTTAFQKGRPTVSQAADQVLASEKFSRAVKAVAISSSKKADQALQNSLEFKRYAKFLSPGDLSEISKRGFVPWLLLTPRPLEPNSSEQQ